MNKKADIAFFMFPIVALALSILALLVIVSFKDDLNFKSKELVTLSSQIEFSNQYIVEQTKLIGKETADSCNECNSNQLKEKFMQIAGEKESNFRYEETGNFYGKIRNGEFTIEKTESVMIISISDLFIQSRIEDNTIIRNFNMTAEIPQ